MKALFVTVAFGIGAVLGTGAYAEAPAGAIAQCKDGTYFTGTTHKGACKGHQGLGVLGRSGAHTRDYLLGELRVADIAPGGMEGNDLAGAIANGHEFQRERDAAQ